MLGDLFVPEVVRRATAGQDEIVVGDFSYRGDELLVFVVDSDDVGQAEDEVLLALKGGTEGEGNRAWLQPRGGYLVDEWGKLMVVVVVNEDDLEERGIQLLGELESGKASASDDHARERRRRKIDTHRDIGSIS